MELISETTTTEYNGKTAVEYKDKEIDIEEYIYNGENEITYNFHRNNLVVKHKVSCVDETSPFTAAYSEYISRNKCLPAFSVSHNGKHGLNFNMKDEDGNDYPMKFVVELEKTDETTYCLNLEEFGVYIFDKRCLKETEPDVYKMEEFLLLEIHYTENRDKLLFIDWEQDEFYAVNIHYQQVLTGKNDKFGKLKSYIQDGEKYIFYYDDNGELDRVETFSGDTVAYIDKSLKYANITYRIPFIKTSYGIIISDPEHVLYCSRYRHTEECEQEIETSVHLLTKEESEGFIEKI